MCGDEFGVGVSVDVPKHRRRRAQAFGFFVAQRLASNVNNSSTIVRDERAALNTTCSVHAARAFSVVRDAAVALEDVATLGEPRRHVWGRRCRRRRDDGKSRTIARALMQRPHIRPRVIRLLCIQTHANDFRHIDDGCASTRLVG